LLFLSHVFAANNNKLLVAIFRGKRSLSGTSRTETIQEKLKAKKRRMERAVLNLTPAQMKETKARRKIYIFPSFSSYYIDPKYCEIHVYLLLMFTELEELKKKFEEDKQKVSLLKQQRKFKPF